MLWLFMFFCGTNIPSGGAARQEAIRTLLLYEQIPKSNSFKYYPSGYFPAIFTRVLIKPSTSLTLYQRNSRHKFALFFKLKLLLIMAITGTPALIIKLAPHENGLHLIMYSSFQSMHQCRIPLLYIRLFYSSSVYLYYKYNKQDILYECFSPCQITNLKVN